METAIAPLKDTPQQEIEELINICGEVFPQLTWSYNDDDNAIEGEFQYETPATQFRMSAKIVITANEKYRADFKIAYQTMFVFSGTDLKQVLVCMQDQIELIVSGLADTVQMFSTLIQVIATSVQSPGGSPGEVKGSQQGFASVDWEFSQFQMHRRDTVSPYGEPPQAECCKVTFSANYKKYPGDVSFSYIR